MLQPISRRLFLALTGSALAIPSTIIGNDIAVPSMLDHVLLGSNDLQRGIDFVQEHTGVRAALGGVHPGRGTQNALLSLGDKRYLEIIGPDPAQAASTNPMALALRELLEPRLVGWAVHPGDLSSFARKLSSAGVAFAGPTPGSRKRPDNQVLQWQTLVLKDDSDGLLPFFIEWSAASSHPSVDAPTGLRLVRFQITTPHPEALGRTAALLSLNVSINSADQPQLRATLAGPKGKLDVTS
jgi:hypothetical protein